MRTVFGVRFGFILLTHQRAEQLRITVEHGRYTGQPGLEFVARTDEPLASRDLRAKGSALGALGITVDRERTITSIVGNGTHLNVRVGEPIGKDD